MQIQGTHYRSIQRLHRGVSVIDQTRLPHVLEWRTLETLEDVAHAIRHMIVRGAPLIGVTAAYGLAFGLREDPSDSGLQRAFHALLDTRPTAINLKWALEQVYASALLVAPNERVNNALQLADQLAENDVTINATIAQYGGQLLYQRWLELGRPSSLNVLTHCNAGWLGCVDWGTALGALYWAHTLQVPLHVWVDETRPRNQGASLTTWELQSHGIACTLITDNAGGYLMRAGEVDACIVGADRVTAIGDVCNKVGTYLKALAAFDNHIPFYVALPTSTIDWSLQEGQSSIPVEDRSSLEVTHIWGKTPDGALQQVQLTPDGTQARNPGFDITPARLVSALITEHGIVDATPAALAVLRNDLR